MATFSFIEIISLLRNDYSTGWKGSIPQRCKQPYNFDLVSTMLRDHINLDEFRIAGEIPLLIKLRLKQLFKTETATGRRVLIIDTCIIGDFIATLPALWTFIQRTRAEVDLIVSPPVKPIAESIKGVRKVFTAKSIYNRSIEKQNERMTLPHEYDRVLVLRISPDAYQLLNHVSYSELTTYDIPFLKYFAHLVWNIFRKKEVTQWRDVNFEMAGIEKPGRDLEFDDIFSVSEAEYGRVKELSEMQGTRKRVVIHTGSGWRVKLWDNEKWIEAIRYISRLGEFDFIFVGGGEHEARSFEYIQQRLDFKLRSLINKVDLKTTLLVMRLSDYFIGIDSGPRNMAHLADLRSITLLGPAPKNFMPVNNLDVVIDKFTCRCKSLFYFHKVSAIHNISADDVVNGFKRLLAPPALATRLSTARPVTVGYRVLHTPPLSSPVSA